MKIVQISDLHITQKFDLESHKTILEKLIEILNQEISKESDTYLVCCGDIVNRGAKELYVEKAHIFFDFIKSNVKEIEKCKFVFVPGNHDLCDSSFDSYSNFIGKYNSDCKFEYNNVITINEREQCFILVNSTYHRDYGFGMIDMKSLEEELSKANKPIIIIMHHTLMSRYENDHSAITNAYKFLELLNKYNVIGVLHGHTHGYSNILVGKKCRIIGTGSLFENMPNCNNQFNVIDIQLEKIEKVENFRYNADIEKVQGTVIYENRIKNFIAEERLSTVYKKVRDTVKDIGGINNLYMNVESTLELFERDMSQNFENDIEIAKKWLQEETPATLYYNHGYYMVATDGYGNSKRGINYVIEELIRNSTSNRAIIPLIHLQDVYDRRFDHLPGLNCIQFGFTNDDKSELYCSVYLRSLEVNHFLKINISEVYLLIKEISKEIRSIRNVIISIYAFKAQYKENFSCFRKARIDMMSSGDVANLIYRQDKERVIAVLKDKFSVEETVVNISGLEQLYDVMEKSGEYTDAIVKGLKEIINEMIKLQEEYRKSSNYDEIRPIERNLHEKQNAYIKLIQAIS